MVLNSDSVLPHATGVRQPGIRLDGDQRQSVFHLNPQVGLFEFFGLLIYTVHKDESFILIGSFGRPGGAGNSDLFISYNENGTWSKPVGLGPLIDTPAREYSPRISPDGKWLYFTSERLQESIRTKPHFTHAEFKQMSRGLYNGLGNIYRVPLEYVIGQTKRKAEK